MEILGTNFSLTLGSWRLCLRFAVEDVDAPEASSRQTPHRIRIVEESYERRRGNRASAN